MRRRGLLMMFCGLVLSSAYSDDAVVVLKPTKDLFARSNRRHGNNGANEHLAIAHASNIRSLVGFDLSSITNEIVEARFCFHQVEAMDEKTTLIVAPMVATTNNAAWIEGRGNLGTLGQNALKGEACYAFSAYPEIPWENASGEPVRNLSDPALWGPKIAAMNALDWSGERWVRIHIDSLEGLEDVRRSDTPVWTIGMWGKSGDGIYLIHAKESKWPPELHLRLKTE